MHKYYDLSSPHKIKCSVCGWYNDPTSLHKDKDQKYYRCKKCGSFLKDNKNEFKDKLSSLLERK